MVMLVRVEDMTLVSIDDHVVEPADLFVRHLPEKYLADAPKVVHQADGTDRWIFQGKEIGTPGLQAIVTWPPEQWTEDPVGFSDMRPGCYDVHDRIRDMDVNGVLSSMCFPTFPGFDGKHLLVAPDRTLTERVVSAYNDWHLYEWAGASPGRMIPLGILPLWDVDLAVKEIKRLAANGFTAVTFPDAPYASGLPSCYQGYWDPVFKALSDHDVAMCLHIGGAFKLLKRPEGAALDQLVTLTAQFSAVAMVDLIVSGTFQRFPNLKVAMSEGGIGWIPLLLDRIDFNIQNQLWSEFGLKGTTGTEVFRKNFLGCFIRDPSALRLWDRIGIDNIAWECDYPHSDSSWPQSPEQLVKECEGAGLTDAQIDQISWENACRFFRFDAHAATGLSREAATVGALRDRARDVDISTTTREEYRRRYNDRLASA
jgi:predicted TIM-barrel fold metal-dependent hydrolase